MGKVKWIKKAIKHKGSLIEFAKKHHAYADGKIQYGKLPKNLTDHRKKQVQLAKNLRKMR